MPPTRVPGHHPHQRHAAHRPGQTGTDVAHWPLERKLVEAARRTTAKLPREMQAQFAALFEPASIAITGAVLLAWAASHAFGAGEVVDVVLLLIGLGTIGWQAFQVGRDVAAFLEIAAGARTTADLDRAAARLAVAVATVGVTVFVALVFRAGAKIGGVARAAVAARSAFWGRTVEEWLILLTRPKAPPLVRERLEVALSYFREEFGKRPWTSILGYLKGIDWSKPVRVTPIPRGTMLAMYGDPDEPGMFLTRIGTAVDRLGINPERVFKADREAAAAAGTRAAPRARQFVRFEVVSPVEALESHAIDYADTWSDPAQVPVQTPDGRTLQADKKYQAGGGGTQYILDVKQLVQQGVLRVVPRP